LLFVLLELRGLLPVIGSRRYRYFEERLISRDVSA
jgi:hypothetical protein